MPDLTLSPQHRLHPTLSCPVVLPLSRFYSPVPRSSLDDMAQRQTQEIRPHTAIVLKVVLL